MKERLIIHLGIRMTDAIDWCVVAKDGITVLEQHRIEGVHALGELADHAKGRVVVCLIPGTEVLMTAVNFPPSQRRQIRRALPFMLEEQLVNPLETSHFALPNRIASEEVPVVVSSREKMEEWTELFDAAQIEVDYLVPDCLALPNPENCWIALVYDDFVLVREGLGRAWVVEKDMFEVMLPLHRAPPSEKEEATQKQDILVYGDTDHAITEILTEFGFNAETCGFETPIQLLAESYNVNTINLLQGDFSRHKDYSGLISQLKPAMIAGAILVALQCTWFLAQWYKLDQQRLLTVAERNKAYKEIFPNTRGKPKSQRVQMANLRGELQKFGSGGADAGFLPMLGKIYVGFKGDSGVLPSSMSFDGKRGELRIDLNGKDIRVLENFKQMTEGLGFNASLSNISQLGDGYRGRVVISNEE